MRKTGRFQREAHTGIHKKRRTVREVFAWGMTPYTPVKCTLLKYWIYERDLAKSTRSSPRRDTVGFLRASGCAFFFNGCYEGAEND